MHIHGLPNRENSAAKADSLQRQHVQAGSTAYRKDSASSSQPTSVTHARSPEILQLVDELRRLPDMREQKLATVAHQLGNGFYLTVEAAEETASKLLS